MKIVQPNSGEGGGVPADVTSDLSYDYERAGESTVQRW